MYEQRYNPYSANVAVVKEYFSGAKILIMGILYILSAIVSLVLLLSESATDYIHGMTDYLINGMVTSGADVPAEVIDALQASSLSATISSVISAIALPMLIALAFILMFAKSRSASDRSDPMAGLTIMFVLSVFALVSAIIVVIGLILLYVGGVIAAVITIKSENPASDVRTLVIISLVIAGVVLVVGVFFYLFYVINCMRFYLSARRSLRSVDLENKGAGAYGVCCVIAAVFRLLGMIGSFFLSEGIATFINSHIDGDYRYYFDAQPYIIGSTVSAVMSILLLVFTAVIAFGYKSHINREKHQIKSSRFEEAPAPVYASTPYRNPAASYGDSFRSAVTCPNCGASAGASEAYCPNCGERL